MARNYVTNFRGELLCTPNNQISIKDEPMTPLEDFADCDDFNNYNMSFDNENVKMRKSMSMSDIASFKKDYSKRCTSEAPPALSRTKFVSMAEAIYHFQRDTPNRFHSSRPSVFQPRGNSCRLELTVAQSPMLLCKQRSRPFHILSQKEREELELEEIRKHKIKAHPIPKSVIDGSNLPDVSKKPVTVPEPFNLTQLNKKLLTPEPVPKFKAREAPKHILEKPQVPVKPPVHVTKPSSPKFHYKPLQDHAKPVTKEKPVEKPTQPRQGPLRPEPFSFEKRDEELKHRKEKKIQQQIEEDRKMANQFKANPLPGQVKRMMMKALKAGSSSTSSENKENFVKFEARPPTVLYKQPFKPVLKPTQNLKPNPFMLTTEKRALEREKFDHALKEKEAELERMRLQSEKEMKAMEDKQTAEMRAKLVHHPQPIPSKIHAPFVPLRSEIPLTKPQTPKFIRRINQD